MVRERERDRIEIINEKKWIYVRDGFRYVRCVSRVEWEREREK
jgi:hypothetical protein